MARSQMTRSPVSREDPLSRFVCTDFAFASHDAAMLENL